jgi:hypothetical protein
VESPTQQQSRALIVIERQGVTDLASLGKLKSDRDISEMAKLMSQCTQADGRVHLGIVVVKDLQTLGSIWWVRDRQKRNLVLNAADFDAATLAEAAEMKDLRKERRADKEPSPVTVLGKFDPDDFGTHEDAFLNLMLQMFGVLQEPLCYIVHSAIILTAFGSDKEEQMCQFLLVCSAFQMDTNQMVYRKLKAFLIDSPGCAWAWIEPHDVGKWKECLPSSVDIAHKLQWRRRRT